jgi:Gram-negative porin
VISHASGGYEITRNGASANSIETARRWAGQFVFALIALRMLTYACPAYCEDSRADLSLSMFSVSGFGTLGLIHSSEDRADYTASVLAPNGAGFTRQWSSDVDSRLGAQVSAHLMPQLSAMLQVIVEQDYDKTYKPHVEWANISYQVTPDFSVRLGRIVLPTFLLSDTRKVGYANSWVRPPVEFYSLNPIFNSDGLDASYKLHVGEVANTLVGTYGTNDSRVPQGGSFNVKRLWVIADTLEYGALTLHVAYTTSSFTYSALDPIFNGFRQFGPQGVALASKYDLDDKPSPVLTVGAMYDPGRWFVMGEWGRRNLHSAIGESTAWYVSGGARLAKFTPYLTYADTKPNSATSDPGLNVSELPAYLAGPATLLNAGLNVILSNAASQNTVSLGSRWDVIKNVDLKLQYDHVSLGAGSAGTLINVQPDFQRGGTVNLFSLAIDFVW